MYMYVPQRQSLAVLLWEIILPLSQEKVWSQEEVSLADRLEPESFSATVAIHCTYMIVVTVHAFSADHDPEAEVGTHGHRRR